ncbi:MAG TPA: ribonuclease J, partial [Lachnospiraceae bacterium]|nr:ribonuclease J [Lachnospiraceae bacterium]
KVARLLGYDSKHIIMMHSGDVLELSENHANIAGHVQNGPILVDGLGVGDVGNIVLRDRQRLAEDGIIMVVMTLGSRSREILAGPDIVS